MLNSRVFFTTAEVARYFRITSDCVCKWIREGKLRAHTTPGGHYRIEVHDLREFFEKNNVLANEEFFLGKFFEVAKSLPKGREADEFSEMCFKWCINHWGFDRLKQRLQGLTTEEIVSALAK